MSPPSHIAFILDGNRRWAEKKGKMAALGHEAGAENVKEIALECQRKGIHFATFWALSTENFKERSKSELKWLFEMITRIPQYFSDLIENNIRIRVIGDISALPERCQETLRETAEKTKDFTSLIVTLAINYGGRDELMRAMKKIVAEGIAEKDITEDLITSLLDTNFLPDPDIIVRTGGRKRLSGYLPWQSIYSELYFTDTLWPDFNADNLAEVITYFGQVQRNFGH